jgi:protein TonB
MTCLPAACLLAVWLTVPAAAGQDGLARAKELYATAAYDEALALLDTMPKTEAEGESLEIAEYRVFCLLALDRQDDARKAIQSIVSSHPLYHLPEGKTSPRIQAVFEQIRRQMFPEIVLRTYAEAKAAFDRHDPDAAARFDDVIALLDDPDAQTVPAAADLRTVVLGFRDLSRAAAAAPPPPTAAPATAPPAASLPGNPPPGNPPPAASPQTGAPEQAQIQRPTENATASRREDSTGERARAESAAVTGGPASSAPTAVVPPVAIYQPIPPWVTSVAADQRQEYKGTLELLVDRTGHVTSVKLRKSINPRYDAELMKAARTWRFRPATKDGEPVPFVKVVDIQLIPR